MKRKRPPLLMLPEDQVLDITVTCDGTWARQGFQSRYGIVVVASWKIGKVLDVEVLNKTARLEPHTMEWILPQMNFWTGGRVTRLHKR